MTKAEVELVEGGGGEMSSSEQCGETDVCVDRTQQNNLRENDENILLSRMEQGGHDETIQLQLSAKSQDLLLVTSLTTFCLSLVAWLFFRHIKHQKEWQQASHLQLKQITQRNIQSNLQPKEEEEHTTKTGTAPTNTTSKSSTCKEMGKDRHDEADQAYERRTKLIREEQSLLQAGNQELLIPNNEAEETERRELLRVQNLEYEESLRRDQERLIQANIEREKSQMKARTLQDAIHRLECAGIYTTDIPIIERNTKTAVVIRDEDKVQVRLMLPSGKRVQATYSKCHSIGLLYDLALLILNYNQHDQVKYADDSTTEKERYNHSKPSARAEWKELFDPFTIQTSFPPQKIEEMDLTLEDCGLQKSVMLMIAVDSD
eukprot:scaffold5472_cov146-Skeletonema_menzelii.AAC.26